MLLTDSEKQQIVNHCQTIEDIDKQYDILIKNKSNFDLQDNLSLQYFGPNGEKFTRSEIISFLPNEEVLEYKQLFWKHTQDKDTHNSLVKKLAYSKPIKLCTVVKFVPASGAASRMLKDLFTYYNNEDNSKTLNDFVSVKQLIDNIDKFAFYDLLKESLQKDSWDINSLLQEGNYKKIVEYILFEKGLNYGNSPKAWIHFHKRKDQISTAMQEHFIEGKAYCNCDQINIHFTVSEQYLDRFKVLAYEYMTYYQKYFGIRYNVTFSCQKPSTDTIALDKDNNILKDDKGNIVFRPGGHGSLIDNLQEIDEDIIFVKNIDNLPKEINNTADYKMALAGMLIRFKRYIDRALIYLDKKTCSIEDIKRLYDRDKELVLPTLPKDLSLEEDNLGKIKEYLRNKLYRPIRICGVVRNTGEPGGGPFIVKVNSDDKRHNANQIVEQSQIDFSKPRNKEIFDKATHFNPVDLVLCIKDYKGEKFNLQDYIDWDTCFVTNKTYKGQTIRVLERPGLWNGAMSGWLTFFVQVPIDTFAPVKTINDLLKPEHQ